MAAPALIVEATTRFLRAHEPFARMARRDLEFFADHARLAYFAAGSVIVDSANGSNCPLYVIQRGHVRSHDPDNRVREMVLGPGECFPLTAAVTDTGATAAHVAAEDVFCFQLAREDLRALRDASAQFADFCTQSLATLMRRSLGQAHREFSGRALDQQTLLQPVHALTRRPPVSCREMTPIRAALEQMGRAGVGTIAIVDAAGRPVGIFTLTDLLARVVLPGVALDTPIDTVMTPQPGAVDGDITAQEAMALMAANRYHQLVITRGGLLTGVVSERDLFALQRVSMQHIMEAIRGAADVAGLRQAAADIATLTDNLVAQGAAAEPLTRTVASLHDALTHRLFELLTPGFDLAGVEWCWLSLGSEGRHEQTIASDQDNALAFDAAGADPETRRRQLLPFARAGNESLAALGVPLCPGNIMAGNPALCLSVEEWRVRFAGWIREPSPEALLAANIFFDFRPLAGRAALAEQLRGWLSAITPESRLFLRLLATNALQAEPPLGVVRSFRTDDEGSYPGTLDLKTHGTRIFVDAARAFALAFGVAETGTAARLRLAGRRLGMEEREVAAIVEAFHFLQLLRLRVQRGAVADRDGGATAADRPAAAANRLDPYALNELDQRMLKESLRQARALQKLLEQTLAP
jgi:CBS domain-containing protein